MSERTHCLSPNACEAKSDRHCGRCARVKSGKEAMARLRSNPEMVERMKVAAARTNSDPVVTARQVASRIKNKTGMRRVAAAARKHMRMINSDPALSAKRAAASEASVAARVQRNAERMAARVGIPIKHVPEYRFLRYSKHYSQAEAVQLLTEVHSADFADAIAAKRIALQKSLGPMPAVGTPERAAWAKQAAVVAAARAKLSASEGASA